MFSSTRGANKMKKRTMLWFDPFPDPFPGSTRFLDAGESPLQLVQAKVQRGSRAAKRHPIIPAADLGDDVQGRPLSGLEAGGTFQEEAAAVVGGPGDQHVVAAQVEGQGRRHRRHIYGDRIGGQNILRFPRLIAIEIEGYSAVSHAAVAGATPLC